MDNFIPDEPMVTIPIGTDCSHTEIRHLPDMTRQLQALLDAGGTVALENRIYKISDTLRV